MVMICIRGRLLSMFILFCLQLVNGNGLRCGGSFKCCSGYKLDRDTKRCLRCESGYHGIECVQQCSFPSYGADCQSACNCSKDQCNHVKGCSKGGIGMETVTTTAPQPGMTIDISVSLSHDADTNRSFPPQDILSSLPTTTDMQKESSIQCNATSKRTTLNRKERGVVISIVALGLLFLILTALYIRVTHRLRVQTNNHCEGRKNLDGNQTV